MIAGTYLNYLLQKRRHVRVSVNVLLRGIHSEHLVEAESLVLSEFLVEESSITDCSQHFFLLLIYYQFLNAMAAVKLSGKQRTDSDGNCYVRGARLHVSIQYN